MKRARTGRYETTTFGGESVKAFIPHPLPPDPPLDLKNLHVALEQALLALGRLDSLSTIVPDTSPEGNVITYVPQSIRPV